MAELMTTAAESRPDVFGADGCVRADALLCPTRFYVGVDLGKAQSHTAIAIVERAEVMYRDLPRDARTYEFPSETRWFLRYAERLALNTPYVDVVEHVRRLVRRAPLAGRVKAVVDATGVGAPVVELMKGSGGLGCPLVPVVITGGDAASAGPGPAGSGYRVPKRDLVHGLVVAFENGWLEMAESIGLALEVLVKELGSMRTRGMSGSPTDDMVLALSLAWWRAKLEAGWRG